MSSSSSGLKCTEHIEEVFPGVQCLRVSFTNFIHRCLLRRTSGLGYQKESYARWFLSLYFESCCIQKPHIFQPFSLFTIEALPRIFGYFCTMSFSYVTLHIWTHLAEWGTNANDGWKYRQDCLHFRARKKKGFNITEFFSKVSSWKIWKSTKRKQIEGLGAQGSYCSKKISSSKNICWYFLLKFLVSTLIDVINMPEEFQKNRWSRSP